MSPQKIGKIICEERKRQGLTQEELARKAGVTRQTLSKIERGGLPMVSMVHFFRILMALGLEVEVKPEKKRDLKKLWTPEELLED